MLSLFGGWKLRILEVAAVVAAVLGVLWRVFAAGRSAERAKQTEKVLREVEIRHEVDQRVTRAGSNELERLRDKWTVE